MKQDINDIKYERGYEEEKQNKSCVSPSSISSCCKLFTQNWVETLQDPNAQKRYVEVRFKNTRKDIYENDSNLNLNVGDIVAVEANSGNDVGIVSAVGLVALMQAKKRYPKSLSEVKKIYRKARTSDIEKWKEGIELEYPYLIKTRMIAEELELNMKLSDVEFQGDKSKAIFYYIAEERVDFRKLIKRLAETFKIKIEMKQIGARQEAGRVGGIGACGRELCCTTWITDFKSVSTNSARFQELSLNPQKLTGQCSKLKCCLNNELETYLEARQNFPKNVTKIFTAQGEASHIKNDIFKKLMYFEYKNNGISIIQCLEIDKVKEIIELNKKSIYPDNIFENKKQAATTPKLDFENNLNDNNIQRFTESKKVKKKKRKKPINNNISSNNNNENENKK